MKTTAGSNKGGGGAPQKPLRLCDACLLDQNIVETANQRPCVCGDPQCSLDWCNRFTRGRHFARRLHREGRITEADFRLQPLEETAARALYQEWKAYNQTLEIARSSVTLTGERLYQSPEDWLQRWMNSKIPTWFYPKEQIQVQES